MPRPTSVAAVMAAVFFAVPAVQAKSLPSLSVPTFSLQFTDYSIVYGDAAAPAAIGLVSASATSTVISLDSFEQLLHTKSLGSAPGVAEVASTIRFEAASGYRITGISFSATVNGVLELPDVSGPDVIAVDYGDSLNYAHAYAGISPAGATQQPTQLYSTTQVSAPVALGGIVHNTQGLSVFDFGLDVFGSSRVESTFVYTTNPDPSEPFPLEGKTWGNAEIHYANPVLTVYTEAIGPLPAVPEPGQWAMLAGGLLLLAGALRSRRG
ncbi:hypothetical protein [Massilia sp. METH4]|uniref:hypothetical protein n=1 Tax=Massilia sp. METH4 TaxID=3123041 RepID=UPI0030D51B01